MQWQSEDPLEYARDVNAKVIMYPAGEPLCADAELTVPWASVDDIPGRFDINYKREDVLKRETKHCLWRCLDPDGEFLKPLTFRQCQLSLESFLKASSGTPTGTYGDEAHIGLYCCLLAKNGTGAKPCR